MSQQEPNLDKIILAAFVGILIGVAFTAAILSSESDDTLYSDESPYSYEQTNDDDDTSASSCSCSATTVYITNTGECYHRGTCRYLYASKIPVSLCSAIECRYRACKVCTPPTCFCC